MSIFGKLKNSKKAADELKAAQKAAATVTPKPPATPYHHVPTHAASDAMAGAPSAMKNESRYAIQEAHRRRMSRASSSTTLAASAMASSRLPRENSTSTGLSNVRSLRTSASFNNAPQSMHLGYAAYAGLDIQSAPSSRPRSRVPSFHGPSPLSQQSISPADDSSHHSSGSSAPPAPQPRVRIAAPAPAIRPVSTPAVPPLPRNLQRASTDFSISRSGSSLSSSPTLASSALTGARPSTARSAASAAPASVAFALPTLPASSGSTSSLATTVEDAGLRSLRNSPPKAVEPSLAIKLPALEIPKPQSAIIETATVPRRPEKPAATHTRSRSRPQSAVMLAPPRCSTPEPMVALPIKQEPIVTVHSSWPLGPERITPSAPGTNAPPSPSRDTFTRTRTTGPPVFAPALTPHSPSLNPIRQPFALPRAPAPASVPVPPFASVTDITRHATTATAVDLLPESAYLSRKRLSKQPRASRSEASSQPSSKRRRWTFGFGNRGNDSMAIAAH